MSRFTRQLRTTGLAIIATAALASCGGGTTDPQPPPPVDARPTMTLQAPAEATEDKSVNIAYTAQDDKGLVALDINFGDGKDTTLNLTGLTKNSSIPHTYTSPGNYTISGRVFDTKNQTGTASDNIRINEEIIIVPDSVNLTFNYKHYFSQETNQTGITAWLEANGQQHTINFNNGTGNIRVEKNKAYRYFQTDNDSGELARLQIGDALAYGYRVIDRTLNQGRGIPLIFTADKTIPVENIDTEQQLKDYAQQTGGILIAPLPGTLDIVAYNGPCEENWNPGDACNNAGAPPGGALNAQDITNFDAFYEDLENIFNDPRIGFNAYTFQKHIINANQWQEHIEEYLGGDDLSAIIEKPGRYLIRKQRFANFREGVREEVNNGRDVVVSSSSSVYLGLSTGAIIPNEMVLFGQNLESGNPSNSIPMPYGICSVRDWEGLIDAGLSTVPGCDFNTTTDRFSPRDPEILSVREAFVVVAYVQPEPLPHVVAWEF